jgi:hypothetical protein
MPAWKFNTLPEDLKREFLNLQVITGETDIDDGEQTETTPFTILTVAAHSQSDLHDVEVWIDLAKATTGYAAAESTVTIQMGVARQVDGTNWRREAYAEAALSGTLSAGRMQKIPVGRIPAGQSVRIMAVTSGDVSADVELPYQVIYRGLYAPTVTPVVAG